MKKLMILVVLAALVVPAVTYANPSYGNVQQFPDGVFAEKFGDGTPGSEGGWIDAEDGFWAIYHAYHPGNPGTVTVNGVECWQTVYTSGTDSWLRFYDKNTGIETYFYDFELRVTAIKGGFEFDFDGVARDADGNVRMTFWGPGEVHNNWATYYNPPSSFEAIDDPSKYNIGGVLDLNATVVPVPGAVLLGGIGVGLVGWFRRRKSL